MHFLILFLLNFTTMETTPAPMAASGIRITIHSLRNDEGTVLLSMFKSADGYPGKNEKAVRQAKGKVKGGTCEIILENVPAGTYAISILHDENNNGKMDTKAFGIPKEGYGASNDAKATFGPPSFADAKFEHQQETPLRIKMRYF